MNQICQDCGREHSANGRCIPCEQETIRQTPHWFLEALGDYERELLTKSELCNIVNSRTGQRIWLKDHCPNCHSALFVGEEGLITCSGHKCKTLSFDAILKSVSHKLSNSLEGMIAWAETFMSDRQNNQYQADLLEEIEESKETLRASKTQLEARY